MNEDSNTQTKEATEERKLRNHDHGELSTISTPTLNPSLSSLSSSIQREDISPTLLLSKCRDISIDSDSDKIDSYGSESAISGQDCCSVDPFSSAQKGPDKLSFDRITVSRSFRELVLNRYPILRENVSHLRFMQLLLFGSKRCDETGELIICAIDIARCEDKELQCLSGNYNAGNFLRRFTFDVLHNFRWRGYKSGEKCRRVRVAGIPSDILEALEKDLSTSVKDLKDRVYFITGERYTRRKRDSRRKTMREEARRAAQDAPTSQTRRVLNYMNDRSPHRFTKVLDHLPQAGATAMEIEKYSKRMDALSTLRQIADQPQPFYQPSSKGNTVRVFSTAPSLLTLKKSVRQDLTEDWYEFDLMSSQLAICAKVWQVEEALSFLKDGKNIWRSLFEHMGFDYEMENKEEFTRIKKALKIAVYSILFGADKREISRKLNDALSPEARKAGKRFHSHPIIKAMFEAREELLATIRQAGLGWDCFGNRIYLTADVNERSILAQQAQAIEMKLLLPVVELAETTDEFDIMLWQHDGFSVAFKNQSKKDRWIQRIIQCVDDAASELGIPTKLEYE